MHLPPRLITRPESITRADRRSAHIDGFFAGHRICHHSENGVLLADSGIDIAISSRWARSRNPWGWFEWSITTYCSKQAGRMRSRGNNDFTSRAIPAYGHSSLWVCRPLVFAASWCVSCGVQDQLCPLFLRPCGFPGVTEYAGRNASVRSASVILFHRALAAREQISARLIPGCFRWRPKSFSVYHALFC